MLRGSGAQVLQSVLPGAHIPQHSGDGNGTSRHEFAAGVRASGDKLRVHFFFHSGGRYQDHRHGILGFLDGQLQQVRPLHRWAVNHRGSGHRRLCDPSSPIAQGASINEGAEDVQGVSHIQDVSLPRVAANNWRGHPVLARFFHIHCCAPLPLPPRVCHRRPARIRRPQGPRLVQIRSGRPSARRPRVLRFILPQLATHVPGAHVGGLGVHHVQVHRVRWVGRIRVLCHVGHRG